MGIENTDFDLEPTLKNRPFYRDKAHCESWVDRGLLIIDTMSLSEQDKNFAKDALNYAKDLLTRDEYQTQDQIKAYFYVLVGEIQEQKEKWGELERIIPEVWSFLDIEMAAENQD